MRRATDQRGIVTSVGGEVAVAATPVAAALIAETSAALLRAVNVTALATDISVETAKSLGFTPELETNEVGRLV